MLTVEFENQLLELYPNYYKIYGPYTRKDNRKHVILYDRDRNKRTLSWPKALMEVKLGRLLVGNETVDHDDENKTNDDYDNLKILTRADNARKSIKPAKLYTFICPECGNEATKLLSNVKGNKKKCRDGPFCSRNCAGRFTERKQINKAGGRKPNIRYPDICIEDLF